MVGIEKLIVENAKEKALEFERRIHQKKIELTNKKFSKVLQVLFADTQAASKANATQTNYLLLN